SVAEPFVAVLLGARWIQTVSIFEVLALLGILYSLGNPIGSLLLAKGRANIGFWMNVLGLIVYVIGIWVGSQWGVQGVAWGLVSASFLVLFPLEFWVRWYLVEMSPVEFFRSFSPFLFLATLMGIGVSILDRLTGVGNYSFRLGLLVSAGAGFYL